MLALNGVSKPPRWWLAGGISPADVVGAWQGEYAESQAASYVNLANPGTNDLTEGTTAPYWNPGSGWRWELNVSDRYLVLPPFNLNHTIIVKYRGVSTVYSSCLFGNLDSGGTYFQPKSSTFHAYVNGQNTGQNVDGIKYFGTVAIAGDKAYFDGVDEGVTLPTGTLPTTNMYLGRLNYGAPLNFSEQLHVQAVAIYNRVLTAAEVAAVTDALEFKCDLGADIFFTIGQSNCCGWHTYMQPCTSTRAYNFNKGYQLTRMADPSGISTGAFETVMEGDAYGSVWPRVADAITAATGRPVIFCSLGVGSQPFYLWWLPDTVPTDRYNDAGTDGGSYASLLHRYMVAKRYGTPRAILVYAGEGESVYPLTQAEYNTMIDTFANAAYADTGLKSMFCKILDLQGGDPEWDETNWNNAVAEAWGDNANVLTGPDLHGIETDDTAHIKSDEKAIAAAALWVSAIRTAFSW